jgi:hypothetical protein
MSADESSKYRLTLAIWERLMNPALFGITVGPLGNIYVGLESPFGRAGGEIRKLSPGGAVLATWPAG